VIERWKSPRDLDTISNQLRRGAAYGGSSPGETSVGRLALMQGDDVVVAPFLADVDRGADFRPVFEAQAPARNPRHRIGPAPAPPFDGTQEGLEVGIERCGLFEVDGVAGIGRYPETGIWQRRLQHQVGLQTGRILVTNDEQDRGGHSGELITQIVQGWS
jgi:hypothetical protein